LEHEREEGKIVKLCFIELAKCMLIFCPYSKSKT